MAAKAEAGGKTRAKLGATYGKILVDRHDHGTDLGTLGMFFYIQPDEPFGTSS